MTCSDLFRWDLVVQGVASSGESGPRIKPPTRSAWLRLRCRKVGWIAARHVGASCATSGSVLSWLVMETTIVLARRPINAAVVGCTQASWCESSRCAERRVVFWH
jgi:hypothetical protein